MNYSEKVVATSVTKKRRSKSRFWLGGRWLFIAPAVIYLVAMFVYPIIRSFIISLQEYTIFSIGAGGAPFIGFQNYIDLFSMHLTWEIMLNTITFVVGSIVFQLVLGMIFALFFSKNFPLNSLIRALLLVPWLLPLIVASTAWKWIFDRSHGVLNAVLLQLNLIDQPIGWLVNPDLALFSTIITNIWVGIPFSMVLFYSGLQDIPNELYEAGKMDGCNAWQRFWYITVPSLRAVISIVLLLALIYTLKVFDVVKILTNGGPANASEILSTWSYGLSFEQLHFGQGAAVANIMIIISLIFSYFYVRANRTD